MKELMIRAWEIKRMSGIIISEAMIRAWAEYKQASMLEWVNSPAFIGDIGMGRKGYIVDSACWV